MLTSRKDIANVTKYVPQLSEVERLEAEQKKNVLLLLENLVEREGATVKMILDCLYDVGSVKFIEQKFRLRPVNKMMRLIARLSKPGFRAIAFYWFKRNCPVLITNWLLSKVNFDAPKRKKAKVKVKKSKVV